VQTGPRIRFSSGKDIPEPQGLVTSPSDNSLPIRRHGQIQDAVCVPSESSNLCHGRVLPENDLVQGVPVRAHNLINVLRPDEIADLRTSIDAAQRRVVHCIPERMQRSAVPPPDARSPC